MQWTHLCQQRIGLRAAALIVLFSLFLTCSCLLAERFMKRLLLSRTYPQLLPFNNLERSHVSHSQIVEELKLITERVKRRQALLNLKLPEDSDIPEDAEFFDIVETSAAIVEAMGFSTVAFALRGIVTNDTVAERDVGPSRLSTTDATSPSGPMFNASVITQSFCYPTSFTSQEPNHKVDPSFCPRLLQLLEEIRTGAQPFLLTLFTWLPNPLADTERLHRRSLFSNWDALRPFVQPVIFSDSRIHMSMANAQNWLWLPVPVLNLEGVPIFRNMSQVVASKFQSTFYGYVSSTTIFDVSLLETLIAIKDNYLEIQQHGKINGNINNREGTTASFSLEAKPILVYGKAMNVCNLHDNTNLYDVGRQGFYKGKFNWQDKKDSLVYFIYTGLNFHDIPAVVVEDKFLTPFLVARSMALEHVVIDASNTVLALHNYKIRTASEWNREYLKTKAPDPDYNLKMVGKRMASLQQETTTDQIATNYKKNGSISFEVKTKPFD